MKKNIGVFTVGRSDLSILRNIIKEIKYEKNLNLKIYAGPAHNSNLFGNTDEELKKLGINKYYKFKINYKSSQSTNINFSKILENADKFIRQYKINCGIIMGDRYEMLAISIALFNLNIPIFHLCGGSVTKGSLDNIYRYNISKMSNYHLVETKHHKLNLKRSGIKKNIYIVGAPALENINKFKININFFYKKFNIDRNGKKLIVSCFHPETNLSIKKNLANLKILIRFLISTKQNIIFTYPNADTGYKNYINEIEKSFRRLTNIYLFKNLGMSNYYCFLENADLMIGNSSSGIIESASFKIPCINVGNRQEGRFCPKNVLKTKFKFNNLQTKYIYALSHKFKKKLKNLKNPYYKKNTSKNVINIMKNFL